MKTILILAFFAISCSTNISSQQNDGKVMVSVIQSDLSSFQDFIVSLEDEKISAQKGSMVGGKFVSKRKVGASSLSEIQLEEIHNYIVNNKLFDLDSIYTTGKMGGYEWTVVLRLNGKVKQIKVRNLKVQEIDGLFEILNRVSPPTFPKIDRYYSPN